MRGRERMSKREPKILIRLIFFDSEHFQVSLLISLLIEDFLDDLLESLLETKIFLAGVRRFSGKSSN